MQINTLYTMPSNTTLIRLSYKHLINTYIHQNKEKEPAFNGTHMGLHQ